MQIVARELLINNTPCINRIIGLTTVGVFYLSLSIELFLMSVRSLGLAYIRTNV